MIVSLMFADRRVEVAESTIELAEMAYADHGRAAARGVLRELIPTLTLLEACAAVAEAVRRLDERTIKPASLTVDDICDELTASRNDLKQASSHEDRQRAREGEAYCRSALVPAGQRVVPVWQHARQQVADRINRRRGIKP
jgi:hypothetical protein